MQADELEPLIRSLRRTPLSETATLAPLCYGRGDIERILPHRAPFLFVDELTGVDLAGRTLTGIRRIDPDDVVFAGHFPGEPVYPGVLQIEAMGQLGLCLAHFVSVERTTIDADTKVARLRAIKVHHALFSAPVLPGDELVLQARVVEYDGYTGTVAGQAWRGSTLCSLSVLEVYFVDE